MPLPSSVHCALGRWGGHLSGFGVRKAAPKGCSAAPSEGDTSHLFTEKVCSEYVIFYQPVLHTKSGVSTSGVVSVTQVRFSHPAAPQGHRALPAGTKAGPSGVARGTERPEPDPSGSAPRTVGTSSRILRQHPAGRAPGLAEDRTAVNILAPSWAGLVGRADGTAAAVDGPEAAAAVNGAVAAAAILAANCSRRQRWNHQGRVHSQAPRDRRRSSSARSAAAAGAGQSAAAAAGADHA